MNQEKQNIVEEQALIKEGFSFAVPEVIF